MSAGNGRLKGLRQMGHACNRYRRKLYPTAPETGDNERSVGPSHFARQRHGHGSDTDADKDMVTVTDIDTDKDMNRQRHRQTQISSRCKNTQTARQIDRQTDTGIQ